MVRAEDSIDRNTNLPDDKADRVKHKIKHETHETGTGMRTRCRSPVIDLP